MAFSHGYIFRCRKLPRPARECAKANSLLFYRNWGNMSEWIDLFNDMLNQDLTQVILSNSLNREFADKIKIRPVMLKGSLVFQETLYRGSQVFHSNHTKEETLLRIAAYLQGSFRQAQFQSHKGDVTVLSSKKGRITVKRHGVVNEKEAFVNRTGILSHNRVKQYILPEGGPIDFLVALGIQTKEG